MNVLSLIWKNLLRSKVRSALMIASIMIAFGMFGVLSAFERGLSARADAAAADRLVVVNKIDYVQPLPLGHYQRVCAVNGVQSATHLSWFGGYFQEPKNTVTAMAVDAETYLTVYGSDYVVADDANKAFLRERTSALVGAELARKWGWKVGDQIPISSDIYFQKNGSLSWTLTIVGLLQGRTANNPTNFLVFHYAYLNETRTFGKDTIGWIALLTGAPERIDEVARMIDGMFANSTNETSTDTDRAFNRAFGAQYGNVGLIVTLVIGAAFATILMIVGNTMVMAIRERTREIGVLKTLGFSRRTLLNLMLGEACALALAGGVLGMIAAEAAILCLHFAGAGAFSQLTLSLAIVGEALAIMAVFGILTGLTPALRAMNIGIAQALKRS
ncbi:ABC transporter permease [Bradyrhizobium sp.]|jgi:putative ABC transport system permease protein|uniref:ABC transporter permease n=1 Tax=Bradyrhizobium sp. TaxID=376 RepID=UPI003C2878E9